MLLISLANLKGLALVKDCDKSVDFAIKYLGKLCSVKLKSVALYVIFIHLHFVFVSWQPEKNLPPYNLKWMIG